VGSVSKIRKLVANLEDKHNIVVDYRTLKQAIQHRLILKKIHCAIKFQQKDWLKPSIDSNTNLRQESISEFDKDFFIPMNNSVYGKTITNILKRQDIKFFTERKKALKYVNKLTFKRESVFLKIYLLYI
jgi:hypothetical protein